MVLGRKWRRPGAVHSVAYSLHDTGEQCSWVGTTTSGTRPYVYVAQGSHASYVRPGHYDGPNPDDDAHGTGDVVPGELVPISEESTSWIAWPGAWGDSDASPPGPRYQEDDDKWTNPTAWANKFSCDAS